MMKRLCTYLKSTSAVVLVVMLLLSMMSGVLTLSASADETEFPVVKNEPVMHYRQPAIYNYRELDRYSEFLGTFQTISLLVNDSESTCKLNDIQNVTFDYYDPEGNSFSGTCDFYYLDKFNTLLVGGLGKTAVKKVIGKQNYFNVDDYLSLFSSLERSSLSINIYYGNGEIQPLDVDMMIETNTDEIGIGSSLCAVLVEFAHSTNIVEDDFWELDNAIFLAENVNENTTKKYYIDIESEDNIVLPMNNMSSRLTLEQTRIGDNIVYNTERGLDVTWHPEGLQAISNEKADKGDPRRAFMLDNGVIVREDDFGELSHLLTDRQYYLVELDDQYYRVSWDSINGIQGNSSYLSLIERGNVLEGFFYTGVPGTEFDQETINTKYPWKTPPSEAHIEFQNLDNEKAVSLLKALKDYAADESTSQNVKNVINSGQFQFWMKDVWGYYGFNYAPTYPRTGDVDTLISVLENGGYYYYGSYYPLGYIRYYGLTQDYSNDKDKIQGITELATFINEWDSTIIDPEKSYLPTYDNLTKVPLKEALNITEIEDDYSIQRHYLGENSAEFYSKWTSYTGIYGHNNDTILNTYVDDTITFSYSTLENIDKGIVYNVINQVSASSTADFYDHYDYNDDSLNLNIGNMGYKNGEYIITITTDYYKMRHIE